MCEPRLDICSVISGHWRFSETPAHTRTRRGATRFLHVPAVDFRGVCHSQGCDLWLNQCAIQRRTKA
jgi:hypothetical protein